MASNQVQDFRDAVKDGDTVKANKAYEAYVANMLAGGHKPKARKDL